MKKRWTAILMLVGMLLALTMGLSVQLSAHAKAQAQEGAVAPLGTAFTYQGRLTDGSSPANGQYDFQFRVYDAGSGGSQVGSAVTRDNVTVTEGLFTVQLDFGSAAFAGDARWLEIAVRPGASTGAYTSLTPRQELTPAPYALYARQAPWSGLTGVPAGFADGVDDTGASSAWSLSGNAGTTPSTHFLGTTDGVSLTLAVSGTAALRLAPNDTSPNLIGGYEGNSVAAGVVGATIGGGGRQDYPHHISAYSHYATIGGGSGNQTVGYLATVGGGGHNAASGDSATVGGGYANEATGGAATVGGGYYNQAAGDYATVGGGRSNQAAGDYAAVGGGRSNQATGNYATVGGGWENHDRSPCRAEGDASEDFAQSRRRHEG